MSTLAPSPVKPFPEDSLERKIYSMVELFAANIPIINDRNRLAFSLLNFVRGAGDPPLVTVKNCKLKLENITINDLAARLETELKKLK